MSSTLLVRETRSLSPLGAVTAGLVAGTVGTMAMDTLLYVRYRREGGKSPFLRWEFSADVLSWDQAPAPAHVGKRLYEGLFRKELPDHRAALVNNIMHWGYGIANGIPYGVVVGSLRTQRVGYGLLFGGGVWATSYVVLPAAGLYKQIWEYDKKTLAKDLGAHLAYGLTTAVAFRLTSSRRRNRT
jgi:hypothetical protein